MPALAPLVVRVVVSRQQRKAGKPVKPVKPEAEAGVNHNAQRPRVQQTAPGRPPTPPKPHLAPEDEPRQRPPVDPLQPPQDRQAAEAPPAVADVLQLLGAPVQPPAARLALRQPPAHQVGVALTQRARQREGADAGEHLAGVRLVACGCGAGAGCGCGVWL